MPINIEVDFVERANLSLPVKELASIEVEVVEQVKLILPNVVLTATEVT